MPESRAAILRPDDNGLEESYPGAFVKLKTYYTYFIVLVYVFSLILEVEVPKSQGLAKQSDRGDPMSWQRRCESR